MKIIISLYLSIENSDAKTSLNIHSPINFYVKAVLKKNAAADEYTLNNVSKLHYEISYDVNNWLIQGKTIGVLNLDVCKNFSK